MTQLLTHVSSRVISIVRLLSKLSICCIAACPAESRPYELGNFSVKVPALTRIQICSFIEETPFYRSDAAALALLSVEVGELITTICHEY
jgi:hypothetical protein